MDDLKPVLKPDQLYFGDNGACFHGALRCAGMTPHFTGRDLSGQRVHRLTARDRLEFEQLAGKPPRCERCGKV